LAGESKRLDREIERDRLVAADLFLKGKSHQEIADFVNQSYPPERQVSRRQVSYDLQHMIGIWQARAADDIGRLRAEQLAKIDKLEQTYWESWERSLKPDRRATTQQKQLTSLVIQDSDGNPVFLQGVERCISMRCKLLGLDRPIKQVLEIEGLNDHELIKHVAGILTSVGIRLDGDTEAGIEPEPTDGPATD